MMDYKAEAQSICGCCVCRKHDHPSGQPCFYGNKCKSEDIESALRRAAEEARDEERSKWELIVARAKEERERIDRELGAEQMQSAAFESNIADLRALCSEAADRLVGFPKYSRDRTLITRLRDAAAIREGSDGLQG